MSEQLDIPADKIEIVFGDTDKVQFGLGAYGSRWVAVGGAAPVKVTEKIILFLALLGLRPELDQRGFQTGHRSVVVWNRSQKDEATKRGTGSMSSGSSPEDLTGAMAAFVDALLPGDEVFPSASAVGAHGILANRLRETVGRGAVDALVLAFISRGGVDAPQAAAASMEAEEPALFETVLTALYYAYYETPAVIAAIRSLGIVYNDAPQPAGYAMRPFDPAVDLPRERRGHFVPTEAVARVDLSRLGLRQGEAG